MTLAEWKEAITLACMIAGPIGVGLKFLIDRADRRTKEREAERDRAALAREDLLKGQIVALQKRIDSMEARHDIEQSEGRRRERVMIERIGHLEGQLRLTGCDPTPTPGWPLDAQ